MLAAADSAPSSLHTIPQDSTVGLRNNNGYNNKNNGMRLNSDYQDASLLGPISSQGLGEGSVRQRHATQGVVGGAAYGVHPSRVSQYTEKKMNRYAAIANSLDQMTLLLSSSSSKKGTRTSARNIPGRQDTRHVANASNATRARARGAAVAEARHTTIYIPSSGGYSTPRDGFCPDLEMTHMHGIYASVDSGVCGAHSAQSRRSRVGVVAGAVAEGWNAAWKFGARKIPGGGGYYDEEGERTVHGYVNCRVAVFISGR